MGRKGEIVLKKTVVLKSNQTFLFPEESRIWIILKGKLDLFCCKTQNGSPIGHQSYFFSLEKNHFLCSDRIGKESALLGAASGEVVLVGINKDDFDVLRNQPVFLMISKVVERTIQHCFSPFVSGRQPKYLQHWMGEKKVALEEGELWGVEKGSLWIKLQRGKVFFLGDPEFPLTDEDDFFPLLPGGYLQGVESAVFSWKSTAQVLREENAFERLLSLFSRISAWYEKRREERERQGEARVKKKREQDQIQLGTSIQQLSEVMNPRLREIEREAGESLVYTLKIIGKRLKTEIKVPHGNRIELENLTAASGLQTREVILKENWWDFDNGVLLAYLEQGGEPVALLPSGRKGYILHYPRQNQYEKVTFMVASRLKSQAFCFYKPLPNKKLTLKDLLRYSLEEIQKSDLIFLFGTGLLASVSSVLFPVITGILFNSVVPSADRSSLLAVGVLLLITIFSGALFQITKIFTLLRIETKIDSSLQAAVWDRLVRLPSDFFKRFCAGDLTQRANGVGEIRRELSEGTVTSFLSALFAFFQLILLFVYSDKLAFVAVMVVVAAVLFSVGIGFCLVFYQRKVVGMEGRISGLLLQLIKGVAKFKISGSEGKAFALWAKEFSRKQQYRYRLDLLISYFRLFQVILPMLSSVLFFFFVGKSGKISLSVGNFIAFTAAFSSFLGAMLGLSAAVMSSLNIIPLYERVRPILETLPEVDEGKSPPGKLSGEIDINHLTFRYSSDSPAILKDLSLKIPSGSFTAFVGPSGSGKSTLIRLLLGFEIPESGTISFDGQELGALDIRLVRKQIGIVLQNGKIMAEDIFSNIVGSSAELTLDDAWDAAEMAGLAQDIEEMPMGMHTMISEGGGTLSGGQRQRLLIARAIVHKPRILIFDEATSALDNKTQALISQNIEQLKSTRIVIAHRLSTIVHADQIYVLRKGSVAEKGTYQELMERKGFFFELAQRQLV